MDALPCGIPSWAVCFSSCGGTPGESSRGATFEEGVEEAFGGWGSGSSAPLWSDSSLDIRRFTAAVPKWCMITSALAPAFRSSSSFTPSLTTLAMMFVAEDSESVTKRSIREARFELRGAA